MKYVLYCFAAQIGVFIIMVAAYMTGAVSDGVFFNQYMGIYEPILRILPVPEIYIRTILTVALYSLVLGGILSQIERIWRGRKID